MNKIYVLLLLCVCVFAGKVQHEKNFKPKVYEIIGDLSHQTGKSKAEVITDIIHMFNAKFSLRPPEYPSPRRVMTCETCSKVVELMVDLSKFLSDDIIFGIATEFCIEVGIALPDVCKGGVESQGAVILYVFRNYDIHEDIPRICSQECGNVTKHDWSVDLPNVPKPPVEPIPPYQPGNPTIKFIHFGDLHIDPLYKIGTEVDCGKPMCCRDPLQEGGSPAGVWGNYGNCDAPYHLLGDMMRHASETHKDISFILSTGDTPPHDIWMQSIEINLNSTIMVNNLMRHFFPGVPVYPAVGNHEIDPVNCYHPYDENIDDELNNYDLIKGIWDDWTKEWLPEDVRSNEFFYSTQITPGLRVIALQSQYGTTDDWWLWEFYEDPAGQLAWLANELQDAENVGDKVIIILHHPLGGNLPYSYNMWKIILRYESTIMSMYAGHSHSEQFKLVFDDVEADLDRAIAVLYIGPSGAPAGNKNPAYSVFTMDANTFAIIDRESYYMDLTLANSPATGFTPEWLKLYSATEDYHMTSLNPQDWYDFVNVMTEDEDMFNLYFKHTHRDCINRGLCEGGCRRNELCGIVSTESSTDYHCSQIPEFE